MKERFLFSLFHSSIMFQIAERVCTLRSLIDRVCGIVGGGGGVGQILKANSRNGGGIVGRVGLLDFKLIIDNWIIGF